MQLELVSARAELQRQQQVRHAVLSSISHAPSLIGMQAVSFRGSPERPTIALSDECDGGDEHMRATVLIADGSACLNPRYPDQHGLATVEGPHERCRGLLEVGVPPTVASTTVCPLCSEALPPAHQSSAHCLWASVGRPVTAPPMLSLRSIGAVGVGMPRC